MLTLAPIPGYLQFRVEIPEGGATLLLRGTQTEKRGLDLWEINEPKNVGIVGRSGDTLTWEREYVRSTTDGPEGYLWTHDGEPVATFGRTGTRLDVPDLVHYLPHTYEARWTVQEAGTFVFQLTNDAEREVRISDLSLSLVPLERPGCGCSTSRESMLPLLLVGCLAGVARRRRPGS